MSPEQYHAYLAEQAGRSGKIKTRVDPKTLPSTITAEQYLADQADHSEHALQVRCVDWFRQQYPGLLLFAVPNAALRSYGLTSYLEDEGLTKGVPDLILAYPHAGKPGLYIEMKTMQKHSKPSDDQIKIQAYLRAVGYEVAMPRTFDEFEKAITEYLHGY